MTTTFDPYEDDAEPAFSDWIYDAEAWCETMLREQAWRDWVAAGVEVAA